MADETLTPPRATKRKGISREPLTLFPTPLRQCSRCKQNRDRSEFYPTPSSRDGLTSNCRHCVKAATAAWSGSKKRQRCHESRRSKKHYSLSRGEYDQKLANQGDACAICRNQFNNNNRGHLDHCHTTRTVRAILCRDCNTILGWARDNAERLRAAATYLEQHRLQTDSPLCETETAATKRG